MVYAGSKINMVAAIAIGMMASITFGFIDALNFLIIETPLTKIWEKTALFDEKTIPIINGGIAAAISIFCAMYIEEYLHKHYTLFKHPIIDALGIIMGTIVVLLLYKLYLNYKKKKTKSKTNLPLIQTAVGVE